MPRTKLLYFNLPADEADRVIEQLNAIALRLGYVTSRFPGAGQGNLAALLIALARGELEITRKDTNDGR